MKYDWFDEYFNNLFPEPEKYNYTPDKIAKRIDRTSQTIYNALRSSQLEGMKLGKNKGTWIIPKKALYKWLAGSMDA